MRPHDHPSLFPQSRTRCTWKDLKSLYIPFLLTPDYIKSKKQIEAPRINCSTLQWPCWAHLGLSVPLKEITELEVERNKVWRGCWALPARQKFLPREALLSNISSAGSTWPLHRGSQEAWPTGCVSCIVLQTNSTESSLQWARRMNCLIVILQVRRTGMQPQKLPEISFKEQRELLPLKCQKTNFFPWRTVQISRPLGHCSQNHMFSLVSTQVVTLLPKSTFYRKQMLPPHIYSWEPLFEFFHWRSHTGNASTLPPTQRHGKSVSLLLGYFWLGYSLFSS